MPELAHGKGPASTSEGELTPIQETSSSLLEPSDKPDLDNDDDEDEDEIKVVVTFED
jgi:hypothetical protein